MYFTNYKKLSQDFQNGEVRDQDVFPYAFWTLFTIVTEWIFSDESFKFHLKKIFQKLNNPILDGSLNSYFPEEILSLNETLLNSFSNLILILGGFYYFYLKNGSQLGSHFLNKIIPFSWIIGGRVFIFYIVLETITKILLQFEIWSLESFSLKSFNIILTFLFSIYTIIKIGKEIENLKNFK